MSWRVEKAITDIRTHKHNVKTDFRPSNPNGLPHRCAHYVAHAIDEGLGTKPSPWGVKSAKDYGPQLMSRGFMPAPPGEAYQPGDVAVIQATSNHKDGHMAMYDGYHWIADFRQEQGLYPGPEYRKEKPSFTVYRHVDTNSSPMIGPDSLPTSMQSER